MKKQNRKRRFSAKPNSATDCPGNFRKYFFSILVFGIFLAGVITPATAQFDFEKYEVVIGSSAKRQTVLTGFLLGDTVAELAVVHIDETGERRLRIYAFENGNWEPKLNATLRREVSFVDVVKIGGRDQLITYERGRLNWFDPESATERELVAVTSNFNPPRKDEIPHVDITRDVNGDGRDDLVVPDTDVFRVFIQLESGTFADSLKLGISAKRDLTVEADGYRYNVWSQSRIQEIDYNRDGRTDLVFWNTDHFEVHLQDTSGLFNNEPKTFTTDVRFDSDELDSLVAPHGVLRRRKDQDPGGKLTGRVLHSLTDMNGDGVADLVVFSLKGGSLWKMHSTYEVYFGKPASDGSTVFDREIGTVISSDGILFGMEQHDFDHDGQIDMMFTIINPGFFKVTGMIISAVFTRSVSLDLKFHRMKGGIYPDKPTITRKIKTVSLGKSGKKAAYLPALLIADINGDGRSDLLMQKGRKQLWLFPGVPGREMFGRRPQKVKVAMPKDREYTWLLDINKDGKQDIFMHYPSTTGPHRVALLISR